MEPVCTCRTAPRSPLVSRAAQAHTARPREREAIFPGGAQPASATPQAGEPQWDSFRQPHLPEGEAVARECSQPGTATPRRGQGPTKQGPQLDQGPGSMVAQLQQGWGALPVATCTGLPEADVAFDYRLQRGLGGKVSGKLSRGSWEGPACLWTQHGARTRGEVPGGGLSMQHGVSHRRWGSWGCLCTRHGVRAGGGDPGEPREHRPQTRGQQSPARSAGCPG